MPRIISPSRSTTRRSTPWVLGWWGPKLTVRMSPSKPRSLSRVIVTPGDGSCWIRLSANSHTSGGAVCQASCSSENSISVEVDDQAQHAMRAVVGTEVDRKDIPIEATLLFAGDRDSGGAKLLDPRVSERSDLLGW